MHSEHGLALNDTETGLDRAWSPFGLAPPADGLLQHHDDAGIDDDAVPADGSTRRRHVAGKRDHTAHRSKPAGNESADVVWAGDDACLRS